MTDSIREILFKMATSSSLSTSQQAPRHWISTAKPKILTLCTPLQKATAAMDVHTKQIASQTLTLLGKQGELMVQENLLLCRGYMVVPESLQRSLWTNFIKDTDTSSRTLHQGHRGIYIHGIDIDIKPNQLCGGQV